MILRSVPALLALGLAAGACAPDAGTPTPATAAGTSTPRPAAAAPGGPEAAAVLADREGRPMGRVTLAQQASGVIVRGELQGLQPGWHAIHIHETGACRPDFQAAGAHFNPTDALHGLKAGGPHAGDLPNFWADQSGTANFEALTDAFSLSGTARVAGVGAAGAPAAPLFDADGASIVIHPLPDDYASEPAGDVGDRLACGEIRLQPSRTR